jgi:hypothetical protein
MKECEKKAQFHRRAFESDLVRNKSLSKRDFVKPSKPSG